MEIVGTFDKNTYYERMYFSPLKTRAAYQVGNKLYKTKNAAAKSQAWAMIFYRYTMPGNTEKPQDISEIKNLHGIACDCAETDEPIGDYGEVQYKHEYCPLHDRKTGYFARLHSRLVSAMKYRWRNDE